MSKELMPTEPGMHLSGYLRVIQKRISTIMTCFVITMVVVMIGTFFSTPMYEASTQILVEKNDSTLLTGKYTGNRHDPEFFETQSQIIRSKNVIKKVVDILALDTNYENYFPDGNKEPSILTSTISLFQSFIVDRLLSSGSADEANASTNLDLEDSKSETLANNIKDNIIVSPVAGSRLMNISFRSESPTLARLIADTIAQAYMEEIMAIKLNSTSNAIEWMTKKADIENERLTQSEKDLQAFMKKHDIITLENHIAILPQKIADLSRRMTEAKSKREELETLRNQIEILRNNNENADTIPGLLDNEVLQSLRAQILTSEHNITELSQKYGRNHPVMIKARADLNTLQQKKEDEIKNSIQRINNEYELARNNELNVQKYLEQTKNEVFDLNEKSIQYSILKREVDTNRALCDALNLHINEQGVIEHTQQVSVWVTEQATTPESPVSPNKTRNMILAAILGLFGGMGLALLLEHFDNTVVDPDEVEERTGVRVLGVVDCFTENNEGKQGIISDTISESCFAESFRALRTSLLLYSPERTPKKILISSMTHEEGKTTTAVNLAKSFAMINNKVLLIDGDMRKPSLHSIYDLPNSVGLSTYLAGNEGDKLIHEIDNSYLHVMPSGPVPPNPSELCSSDRLQNMIMSLEEKFDFIIIDSPPILGIRDGLLLSKIVDGTIFVTMAGKISYDSLQRGLKLYKDIQATVIGIVINSIDHEKSKSKR